MPLFVENDMTLGEICNALRVGACPRSLGVR
jgi:hypothetical protein